MRLVFGATLALLLSFATASMATMPSLESMDPVLRAAYRPSMVAEAPAVTLAGKIDPLQYRVGPGDRFELNLAGRMTRSSVLVVGPEGMLFVPDAGAIPVTGLTLQQARGQIEQHLSQYIYRPDTCVCNAVK